MTYAEYWIRQSVQRYLEKCGSVIKIPSHTRQKIVRYKKTVQELGQGLGRAAREQGGHIHFHVFPRYENDGFGWNYPAEQSEFSGEVAKK